MGMIRGSKFRIAVALLSTGTFTPVGKCNAFNKTNSPNVSEYPYFGDGGAPATTRDSAADRMTIGGFLDPADPGQEILRDAFASGDTIYAQIRPEGGDATKGYVVPIKVNSQNHRAGTTGYQEHGWDVTSDGVAVAETSGGYVI